MSDWSIFDKSKNPDRDKQPANWILRHYNRKDRFDSFDEFVFTDRDIYMRWGVVVTFLIYSTFFWMDWVLYPENAMQINLARGIYCAFMLLFLFFYSRRPTPTRDLTLVVWVTGEAIALTAFTVISGDGDAPYIWSLIMMTATLGMVLNLSKFLVCYVLIVPIVIHHVALTLLLPDFEHDTKWIFMWTLLMVAGSYSLGVSQMLTIRARQIFDLSHNERKNSERLTQANRDLESFSYSVAHDLKTPLRAIEGLVIQGDSEKAVKRLHDAHDIIDQMLTLSGVAQHRLKLSCVNLGELCQSIFETYHPNKAACFGYNGDMNVMADEKMMEMAFSNLIDNALKYSPDDRPLKIRMGVEYQTNLNIKTFYFQDNGNGFEEEQIEEVFRPFFQGDPESEGCGVGLATVRRIIEGHKGKIYAKNDNGAKFYFTLNAERLPEESISSESELLPSDKCCVDNVRYS